ncbi:MAG: hypothetical protein LBR82_10615, partial [Desulfovibrio sp.]|nr:hypothetical protein [Desulfovibrio sp.]
MKKKTFSCGVFAPAFRLSPILSCLVCLPAVLCLLVGVPAAGTAGEAGIVIEITPGAFVERGGEKIPLELKTPVHSGDTLITDATGRLRVFMED